MNSTQEAQRFPVGQPQTLIGQWIRAGALERVDVRNRLRESILSTGGFTRGRVEVVFQTFGAAAEKWWPLSSEFDRARAMTRRFIEYYEQHHTFDRGMVERLLRNARGEHVPIGDIVPEVRFLICHLFFLFACIEGDVPQQVIDEIILLGESRATVAGFVTTTPAEP